MSHLWSRMLGTGRVGLDDEFFQLGGNSLLAAEMLAHVRVMFGISPDYVRPLTRCLLRDPTLRGFSEATQDARAGRLTADGADPRIDFIREAELADPVRLDAGPRTGLETTARDTAHRVDRLLRGSPAARAADRHQRAGPLPGPGAQHLACAAAHHPGCRTLRTRRLAIDRVVPVVGDIAEPNLGLPDAGTFSELARTIDIIHHAGATVNFIYPYQRPEGC